MLCLKISFRILKIFAPYYVLKNTSCKYTRLFFLMSSKESKENIQVYVLAYNANRMYKKNMSQVLHQHDVYEIARLIDSEE